MVVISGSSQDELTKLINLCMPHTDKANRSSISLHYSEPLLARFEAIARFSRAQYKSTLPLRKNMNIMFNPSHHYLDRKDHRVGER
jgi:hypothetical protein